MVAMCVTMTATPLQSCRGVQWFPEGRCDVVALPAASQGTVESWHGPPGEPVHGAQGVSGRGICELFAE